MQLAGLGAVALVHEDRDVPLGGEIARQGGEQILHILVVILFGGFAAPFAEFVDQRADQPILHLVQPLDQVVPAFGADDLLSHADKELFDLVVQFFAVGDDQHPGIGVVGQDPLGQPHHGQGLSAALGVPDDAALLLLHQTALSAPNSVILVITADLFPAFVEDNKVVDQIEKTGLLEHGIELPVQFFLQPGADVCNIQIVERKFLQVKRKAVLFPLQILFLRRHQRAVAQALAGVACHAVLDGGKEAVDEMLPLVGQILADAVGDGDRALFELQHRQGDPVDIHHQIRALGVAHDHRDLFRNGEVVLPRLVEVQEIHRHRLAVVVVDLGAVFQQRIDLLIGIIQPLTEIVGRALQPVDGAVYKPLRIPAPGQPGLQPLGHDVAVLPVMKIAQVCIMQLVRKEADHMILRHPLRGVDGRHQDHLLEFIEHILFL